MRCQEGADYCDSIAFELVRVDLVVPSTWPQALATIRT